ncbi:hypothetical protein ABPG75_010087 [Micractinium tetrahymenae]
MSVRISMTQQMFAVIRQCGDALRRVAASPGSKHDADRLTALSLRLADLDSAGGFAECQRAAVEETTRELLALAERAAGFNAAIKQGNFAALSAEPARNAVMAASSLAAYCVHAAASLEVSAQDAFRISSAAALIFESGRATLAIERALGDAAALRKHVFHQLAAAFALTVQLYQLNQQAAAAAAAFAGSMGRPAALLGWLQEVAAAVAACPASEDADEESGSLLAFCGVLHTVLDTPPFARHAADVAANPALQLVLARALLQRCLAVVAAAALSAPGAVLDSASTQHVLLHRLALCIKAPSLNAGISRCLREPGNAPAAGRRAPAVAAALPRGGGDGVVAKSFAVAVECAYIVLLVVCKSLLTEGAPPQNGSGSGRQADAEGCSTSVSSELPEVAWHVVRLVPRAAETVQLLAADASGATDGGLQHLCGIVGTCLLLVGQLPCDQVAPAQLAAWAEAAEAGLCLQPLLARLHGQWERQELQQPRQGQAVAGSGLPPIYALLSRELLNRLWLRMPNLAPAPDGAAHEDAAVQAAGERLWQAHSTGCRLVHWLAADASRCLASLPVSLAAWPRLILGLNLAHERAANCVGPGARGDLIASGLCLAHWQAVKAAMDAGLAGLPAGPISDSDQGGLTDLALACIVAFSRACERPGTLVGQLAPVCQAVDALAAPAQGRPDSTGLQGQALIQLLRSTVESGAAAACPPLLADFATSGLLGQALRAWSQQLAAAFDEQLAQVRAELDACLRACHAALEALANTVERASVMLNGAAHAAGCNSVEDAGSQTARAACAAEAVDGQAAELGSQLAAAAQRLHRQLAAAVTDGHEEQGSVARELQLLQDQLLPAALDAAAALQRYWARPEQVSAVRVVMAHGAAARSCANLRCPNVGLEGGPAAGQGRGCKRCGGCRAVFYCSVACSKADWRSAGGGHKWTCAALAAEAEHAPAGP